MIRSSPSARRYLVELVGRELDCARLAAIPNEPDAWRVESQKPRRIHPVAAKHRLLAGWANDDELFDERSVACERFAGKALADAQVNPDRLIDIRRECRRLEPEVVRGEARGGRGDEDGDKC